MNKFLTDFPFECWLANCYNHCPYRPDGRDRRMILVNVDLGECRNTSTSGGNDPVRPSWHTFGFLRTHAFRPCGSRTPPAWGILQHLEPNMNLRISDMKIRISGMKIRCAEYENKDSCTTIRIKLILNISICHACQQPLAPLPCFQRDMMFIDLQN